MQFGIEIDVAAFEENDADEIGSSLIWAPPVPTETIPMMVLTDVVEILVFNQEAGPILAGAIELVSPANKDRPAHRDAFVSKCAAYLQQGIGLLIADVVTDRRANFHNELLARLDSSAREPWDADLYAAAYHPVDHAGQTSLDIWREPLEVGAELPTLPLWLRGGGVVPVDLDASYARTCREQRLMPVDA